ncbi:hypothetical protein [Treponema zioleckii]|nr:hypothetical protein [Treponema zioleckii]
MTYTTTFKKAKELFPLRWGKRNTKQFNAPEFEVLNPKKTA